jgi:hypothetical protein
MGDVLSFKRKDGTTGVDLSTLSGDLRMNVFFPGKTPEHTIIVQTSIEDLNDTIKSETHQLAVWHALCQLDEMRKNMYAGAQGVAGFFGPKTQIELQLGLIQD